MRFKVHTIRWLALALGAVWSFGAVAQSGSPGAEGGTDVGGTAVSVLQQDAEAGDVALNHLFRLELARRLGRGRGVLAVLEWGRGAGLQVDSPLGINETVVAEPGISLRELAWVSKHRKGRLCFKAGLLDLPGHLDVNGRAGDETTRFLGAMFVQSPIIPFPAMAVPGLAVHHTFGERVTLGFLTAETGALEQGTGALGQGTEAQEEGGARLRPFLGLEAVFHAPGLRAGNYRVLFWQTAVAPEDGDNATGASDVVHRGLAFSFEQELWSALALFARGGLRHSPELLETFLAAGGTLAGGPWRRPDDELGLAVGGTLCRDQCHDDRSHDRWWPGTLQAELFYRVALGEHWEVTPGLQWVHDRRPQETSRHLWVAQVRVKLSF